MAAERQDIGKLESLNVYAQATGRSVPLKQVADISLAWQYAEIVRRDRLKTVTVSADLLPGVTASEITRQIVPWLEAQAPTWPVGYRFELGGEAETSEKANASIRDQVPAAVFIILLLLVAQFNSLRRTLIIMVTIPLGFIGVIIGLFAARLYFGFMTLLGIISLAGIVVNNAIVLLERIRLEEEVNRLTPQQAVVAAGQRRLRPIILTSATTVFGLLPLYLWGGAIVGAADGRHHERPDLRHLSEPGGGARLIRAALPGGVQGLSRGVAGGKRRRALQPIRYSISPFDFSMGSGSTRCRTNHPR